MKTQVTSKIPIFASIKCNCDDNILMNKEALKYFYVLINDMCLFDQTYIISNNQEILDYAKELGFNNIIYQECKNKVELLYLDYIGIYNYYKLTGYKPDWILVVPSIQLFINKDVIYDCIRNIDDEYDAVLSYTWITNKSNYFLINNKLSTHGHLLSNEKDRQKMVDSAIYAVKTDFAIHCMEQQDKDPATIFWEGKFNFFENTSIYTDIVSLSDIKKYEHINHILNEVEKLN